MSVLNSWIDLPTKSMKISTTRFHSNSRLSIIAFFLFLDAPTPSSCIILSFEVYISQFVCWQDAVAMSKRSTNNIVWTLDRGTGTTNADIIFSKLFFLKIFWIRYNYSCKNVLLNPFYGYKIYKLKQTINQIPILGRKFQFRIWLNIFVLKIVFKEIQFVFIIVLINELFLITVLNCSYTKKQYVIQDNYANIDIFLRSVTYQWYIFSPCRLVWWLMTYQRLQPLSDWLMLLACNWYCWHHSVSNSSTRCC